MKSTLTHCMRSFASTRRKIHGLGPSLALKLVGECGTDLSAWPNAKHFTSWLCLVPAQGRPEQ
jgi:transposase